MCNNLVFTARLVLCLRKFSVECHFPGQCLGSQPDECFFSNLLYELEISLSASKVRSKITGTAVTNPCVELSNSDFIFARVQFKNVSFGVYGLAVEL